MSFSEPVEKLLARVEGVRRNGSGAMARCPAHKDGTASLSIKEGDDGCALITCHAGCPPERIVAAVNLAMADLFDASTRRKSAGQTKKSGGLGRVVAKYEYRDERDGVRYLVFRYEPKTFRPWRPNGHGGLLMNLDGVTPLPYRLPELLAAIGRDELVFLTEGEKDADRLAALGVAATTNNGGADNWQEEITHWFTGGRFCVLNDNDDAGRKRLADVVPRLHSVGATVTGLDLPNLPLKGDVSDWLDAGGTIEQLERLAAEAEPLIAGAASSSPEVKEPTEDDDSCWLSQYDEPGPQEYVLERLIPRGYITTLFAAGGSRKSFLGLFFAFAIRLGRDIFGQRAHTAVPVLFLDGELDRDTTLRRMYKIARGLGMQKLPEGIAYRRVGSLLDPQEIEEHAAFIQRNRIGITIVDSFSACLPCADHSSMGEVSKNLKLIERKFGTVLNVDHVRKNADELGEATPFGSVAKINFSRSVLHISGTPEGAILKQTKANFDALIDPVAFTLNFSAGMVCLDKIELDDARVEEAAKKVLTSITRIRTAFEAGRYNAGATAADVAEEFDISPKTAMNKMRILTDQGLLRKDGKTWFLNSPGEFVPHSPVPRPLRRGDVGNGESPRESKVPLGNEVTKSEGLFT